MVFNRLMAVTAFAGSVLFAQVAPKPTSDVLTHWQTIDQLCGQLQLAPKKKQIIVDGKSESRLYAAYLESATVTLYRATSQEEQCCKGKPIATTRSRRYGAFEFEGIQPGSYWLRVQKNESLLQVPVQVTQAFDQKACHDPSVGRSIMLDSSPPKIEMRIR
jgi:hypothetical protein